MKPAQLTAERITELALVLSMLSSQRSIGLVDTLYQQFEQALRWHRRSCRPIQIARRLVRAVLTRRAASCLDLIAQQKAMLRLATDEGADGLAVLEALLSLSTAQVLFELGPDATPKQRLALGACKTSAQQARFALLVRQGDIASGPDGLRLLRVTRRRLGAYATFAMFAAWPGLLFIAMALDDALSLQQLAGYLTGSVGISAWLTSGLFTEIRSDERVVQDMNAHLSPRPAVPEVQVV